jgi:adenylate cyclase
VEEPGVGEVERRLTAILAIDVVGYSRLMEADEVGTLARLKALRADIIDPTVAKHHGTIVKTMGDGLLIEFSSIVEAVEAAVTVQRASLARNGDLPEAQRIRFRMGINLGDVIVEDGDIFGDGVNVAARLEAFASPGGICVRREVRDQIRGKLDLAFEDMGEVEVKNIARPVRVDRILLDGQLAASSGSPAIKGSTAKRWIAVGALLLALFGAGLWWQQAPDVEPASRDRMAFELPDEPSIAVLPFDNLSDDPEREVFVDGFTDNIITTLAQVPRLFVIARNSTFAYKGKPIKVRQVAEELGVEYVLHGSIQRSGETLRISAQLVNALSGEYVWAARYDRNMKGVFALQDEIAFNILTALEVALTEGERARIVRAQTENLEAYLRYLQAARHYRHFTREDNERARQLAEQAIALDPEFAGAWLYLGWTHQIAARFGWSPSAGESYERATEIAQEALSLDDKDPGVYSLLGAVHRSQRNFDEALAMGRRAVALAPNVADYHANLAVTTYYAGDFEETIALVKAAMRLHPNFPDWYLYRIGVAYRMLGRYGEAEAALKQFYDRLPKRNLLSITALAATYGMMGRDAEARALVAEARELDPDASVERVAKMHYFRDPTHLERILDALREAGLPEQ